MTTPEQMHEKSSRVESVLVIKISSTMLGSVLAVIYCGEDT